MGLFEEILAEIVDVGIDVVSQQSKKETARKARLNKSYKEIEDFFQNLGHKYNKDNKRPRNLSVKSNTNQKSTSESKTPIELSDNKHVEDIPIEERLRRYKQTKKNEDNRRLQRNKDVLLTFKILEKKSRTKKYKQILNSREGAKDAFIYSSIFERKV